MQGALQHRSFTCLQFGRCKSYPQRQRCRALRSFPVVRATAKEETEKAESSTESTSQETKDQPASTSEVGVSGQELRELASTRRKQTREDEMGLIEGILDETRRISWPSPLQAVKDTVNVVGIVVVSAVVLFGLNTALTEGSRLLYSKLGR